MKGVSWGRAQSLIGRTVALLDGEMCTRINFPPLVEIRLPPRPWILTFLLPLMIVHGTSMAAQPRPIEMGAADFDEAAKPKHLPGDARRPVVHGRLPNGLQYAILQRRGNEPGVGFLMRVRGGFLAERRPGERGLAHLIEHLVFHCPTDTAPNELRRFRQVGMPLTLPEPAGGTTTWRESDYFVVSRTANPADIGVLLGLFREVASELTFRDDAVESQRAEVMREMADKQLGNDIYADYVAAVAPGSPTDVIDAQNSDDVPGASIETIRDLYRRLYRPENTTIVIVGDVDATEIATAIRERFGSWRGVGLHSSQSQLPRFQPAKIAAISHSAQKYGRNSVMMTSTAPMPPVHQSREPQANAMLMDMLAVRAVNNRMALLRADYPPGKYGFFIENGEQGHRLMMLWDEFLPGKWPAAVASLKGTACDLSTVGFSEREMLVAKREVLEEFERRVNDVASAPNSWLAKELADAATADRELIPPDELLDVARSTLPAVNALSMNEWWGGQWRAGIEHLRVESPALASKQKPASAIRAMADNAVSNPACKMR